MPHDFAIFNQEGLTRCKAKKAADFKGFHDRAIRIGQQGERQVLFLREFLLRLHLIQAHADHMDASFGQGFVGIPQAARLRSAAWGAGFGVKINQRESCLLVFILKLHSLAILIHGFNLGCRISFHFATFIGLGEQAKKAHGGNEKQTCCFHAGEDDTLLR